MFAFESIHSNFTLKEEIKKRIKQNNYPSSSIFFGNEGDDKLRFVIAIAQSLLCSNLENNGDACQNCHSCKSIQNLSHPDLHFSFPIIKSKDERISDHLIMEWKKEVITNPFLNVYEWVKSQNGDSKEPNITTEECQNIIRKLNIKSFYGGNKVLIVWMVEYLGNEGNRLLKLVEEPQKNTYIIFITEKIFTILPTLLSRCQLFKIRPMENGAMADILINKFGIESKVALSLASESDGNILETLSFSKTDFGEKSKLFFDWLRICFTSNYIELILWLDKICLLKKEEQKEIFKIGLRFFKELIHLKFGEEISKSKIKSKFDGKIDVIKDYFTFQSILEMIKILENEIYFIERNCNLKMQMIHTTGRVHQIFNAKTKQTA